MKTVKLIPNISAMLLLSAFVVSAPTLATMQSDTYALVDRHTPKGANPVVSTHQNKLNCLQAITNATDQYCTTITGWN